MQVLVAALFLSFSDLGRPAQQACSQLEYGILSMKSAIKGLTLLLKVVPDPPEPPNPQNN
eukprot:303301-Amphidinium_carterae.1